MDYANCESIINRLIACLIPVLTCWISIHTHKYSVVASNRCSESDATTSTHPRKNWLTT